MTERTPSPMSLIAKPPAVEAAVGKFLIVVHWIRN
jgi:hypothetical protein